MNGNQDTHIGVELVSRPVKAQHKGARGVVRRDNIHIAGLAGRRMLSRDERRVCAASGPIARRLVPGRERGLVGGCGGGLLRRLHRGRLGGRRGHRWVRQVWESWRTDSRCSKYYIARENPERCGRRQDERKPGWGRDAGKRRAIGREKALL